jgi:hypothetical protein
MATRKWTRNVPAVVYLLAALVATGALANASIIGALNSVTPLGPNFAFDYRADLTGDERLDPVATHGITCPGPVLCNPPGTFFTIYDIPGFVSASTSASGWGVSIQSTGLTPSTINGAFDNPALVNITFSYTGPVVHASGSTLSLTGFEIVSSLGGINFSGNFTSQSTDDSGVLTPTNDTNQTLGTVGVPQAANGAPEPAPFLLSGAGMLVVMVLRRKH